MKPLVVLLLAFGCALLTTWLAVDHLIWAFSARVAMAMMLAFTAIGHFAFTRGMEKMIPTFIPFKRATVYLTGVFELAAAVGLLTVDYRETTGWLLIIFFIMILPANLFAAMKKIDYQKGTEDGPGLEYLWFRVPLQMLFILWVYFSAISEYWYL